MNEPSSSPDGAACPQRLRVLLLEDDSHEVAQIQERLAEAGLACDFSRVQTEDEFQAALSGPGPDVILADTLLPSWDCFEALRTAAAARPDVPFLFVTEAASEERAIEGLRNGATDYVLKDRLGRLGPAVGRAVREARERAQGQRLEVELRRRVAQLAEAERRQKQFLAVLAHELRNPLAPIRYVLPLLHSAARKDRDVAEACAVLERQVRHLTSLVDDLLDVFRISHQQLRLEVEALDLTDLVRQVAADHRTTAEEAGLTLSVDLPPRAAWVDGDATRLSQVLSNLLLNAVKFNKAGGEIAIRLSGEEGPRAVVVVRDTGLGIEPEMLPHVFEKFAQADDTLTRRQGGLGLGLALVKGFVELHGGQVTASSRGRGHGTEITFWLPLSQSRGAPAPRAILPAALRRLSILIVEDSVDAARSLQTLLKRVGHEVVVTHSGPEGLEAARGRRPDVVLCDIGLPDMDGYEVGRRLRDDPATASVRLIAITGHGQEEDRRRSEEAGFDLHLTKPVDPQELQRLLAVLKVGRE